MTTFPPPDATREQIAAWERERSEATRRRGRGANQFRPWSDDELALIRRFYLMAGAGPVNAKRLAKILRRSRAAVRQKAKTLGLSSGSRVRLAQVSIQFPRRRMTDEEVRALMSATIRRTNAAHGGHMRPMLGKTLGEATKRKISEASRRTWADPTSKLNSEEQRQQRAANASRSWETRQRRNAFSRCRRGRRDDLGDIVFRSSWEANYARFLNQEIAAGRVASWEHEAHVFRFSEAATYTPDFRVCLPDGSHEWHEVKGWMTEKGRRKLALMSEHFPNEVVRLVDEEWFRRAERGDLARSIPGWERP